MHGGGTVLTHFEAIWFFVERSCHHLSLRNQTDSTYFNQILDFWRIFQMQMLGLYSGIHGAGAVLAHNGAI
jgi:hypothetical protein